MNIRLVAFGEIEIEGEPLSHDVVIDAGVVCKRAKGASKAYRGQYGHTPLSAEEYLPWGGAELIVGTGMYGSLPIMPAVEQEAERRGVRLVALPTGEACELLSDRERAAVFAVLHITC